MGVDARYCARTFYTLESLKLIVETGMNFASKAQERLLDDIIEYRERYIAGLKEALYDYTALVVFGEMRHGLRRSTHFNPTVPEGGGRSSSYYMAEKYDPTSILIAGEKLFEQKWTSSYGGEKWRNICNRVLLKDKIDDGVYVDMCFSLSHNCSPYLDKAQSNIFYIDDIYDYKGVLDFKFHAKKPVDVIEKFVKFVGRDVKKLVTRAIVLGLISENVQQNTNSFACQKQWKIDEFILQYSKIGVKWGNEWLSSKLIKHRERINDKIYSAMPDYVDSSTVKVGDILEVAMNRLEGFHRIKKGMKAKVVGVKCRGRLLQVVFRKHIGGHDLNGKCKHGYGLNLDIDGFKKHIIA